MQRFNQSPRSAARSRGRPIRSRRSPPRSPPQSSILDSPSGLSSPRRGTLRQATLLDFTPFESDEDYSQLSSVFRKLLLFLRDQITEDEAETAVRNLQGHRDIKDMFPENLDLLPRLRRILDMLELIESKIDALESAERAESPISQGDDENVSDASTIVASDSETESEIEEDIPGPPRLRRTIAFMSDSESDGELEDLLMANGRSNRRLDFDDSEEDLRIRF